MLGPLHIEQNFLKVIGDWLEGSGWTKIYDYSSVSTSGRVDSFLTVTGVSGIKRSRYAHQLTLSVLVTLAREGFELQLEYSDYSQWQENLERKSTKANYLFKVIKLEKVLLV